MMLAPAFPYAVGIGAPTLAPADVHAWMTAFHGQWGERNLSHTPLYMQFLRGERSLSCVPWGTVTYSVHGWKRPCYLVTDGYAGSCADLLAGTDWEAYGPGRDPRCAGCMLHSGFEPAVMSSLRGPADLWRMVRWQLGG
jgi:hypothetical protein